MSHWGWVSPDKSTLFLVSTSLLLFIGLAADVNRRMWSMCFNHFWLRIFRFQAWSSQGTVRGSAQQLFFGLLIDNIALISFLVLVLILFGLLWSWLSKTSLESIPLALGPDFRPLVEFWVRLSFLKIQVHVVIAPGTPHGIITKTPLTLSLVKSSASLD